MIFTGTRLAGAFVLDLDPMSDDRGFFARSFCQDEFAERGLTPVVAQANISVTHLRGGLRGLHFQYPPVSETRVVRCTRGAIFDVIVDLRPESPTFLETVTLELTAGNHRSLYVPDRFAHGMQALDDNTEVTYLMGEKYVPVEQGGLMYDDPRLAIAWPLPVTSISARDRRWQPLALCEADLRARMRAFPS